MPLIDGYITVESSAPDYDPVDYKYVARFQVVQQKLNKSLDVLYFFLQIGGVAIMWKEQTVCSIS